MSHPLDRERILDLWAQGFSGPDIGGIIGHPNSDSIKRVVSMARAAGDERAVARNGKAAPLPAAPRKPPLHELLGIKTKRVRMAAPASCSIGVTYLDVTLPSLGRFDAPEAP